MEVVVIMGADSIMVAINIMALGYTRIQGVQVYDSATLSFPYITPAKAKKLIDEGTLKGVRWIKNCDTGAIDFEPDADWNLQNITVLSGLTTRLWRENYEENVMNSIYSVVKETVHADGNVSYTVISNTCQRLEMNAEQVKGLASITEVGGVVLENEEIKLCDGVIHEVNRQEQDIDLKETKGKKEKASVRNSKNIKKPVDASKTKKPAGNR